MTGGSRRVLIGRIRAAHGVKGLVRLESYAADPAAIADFGPLEDEAGRAMRLSLRGEIKGAFLAALDGVTSREAAEALAGVPLYVRRAALPEPGPGEYYAADLEGLSAVDARRGPLGRIAAVVDFGAGPLLEIAPVGGGDTVLVPFTAALVPAVDLAAGTVTLALPEGLWPEGPAAAQAREA